MNYTLHQLLVFSKVVEFNSITKAAHALHLTQPAVSIQLKNFQGQFDAPLTEVVGRKLYITDFGLEIAKAANNILAEVAAIDIKSQAYSGHLTGKLKFAVVSTGKYIMPYYLSGFLREHPAVELSMDVTNRLQVNQTLERNAVDFALVSVKPEEISSESFEILPNYLYLVANAEQRFTRPLYERSILESLPMIFREQGSGTRYIMEKFISTHGLHVKTKLELTSNEAVKQAVLAGLGCSVMPLIGIKNELINKTLQIVPVKGLPLKFMWQLVWMKGKNFSPVASAYLNYLQVNSKAIARKEFGWYKML